MVGRHVHVGADLDALRRLRVTRCCEYGQCRQRGGEGRERRAIARRIGVDPNTRLLQGCEGGPTLSEGPGSCKLHRRRSSPGGWRPSPGIANVKPAAPDRHPRGVPPSGDTMHHLLRDLSRAARSLRRSPAFTVTAVLSVAAGIFVVACAFSVTNAYMLRSMPFPAADRLVRVGYAPVGEREPGGLAAMDWRALSDVVEWVDRSIYTRLQLGDADDLTGVLGLRVAPGSLEPLGARIAAGRDFRAEEYRPGAEHVIIAGASVMRGRTLGDSAPIYLDLRRANSGDPATRYRVIGVLEPGYRPPRPYSRGEIDFILPQTAPGTAYAARLRPGVELATAERRITEEVRRAATSLPAGWTGVELAFIQEEYVSTIRSLLIAMTAAAALVLLIATANVAVLLVLRSLRREREIAIRLALGARTRQIAGLLGAEAVLVCAAAIGLGVAATVVALRLAAPAIEARLGLPVPGGTAALAVDGTVLLATSGGAIAVALLLTLAPLALPVMRRFGPTLRGGARGGTDGPGVRRARSLLVALQVAVSVALLFGGALIARSVSNLVRTDLGYDAESIVRARIRFPERPFPDSASIVDFQRAFEEAVPLRMRVPMAIATVVPFWEKGQERIEMESGAEAGAAVNAVGPRYFEVTGIPMRAGRSFTSGDDLRSGRVAVVSETFARTLGAGRNVIGHRLRIGSDVSSQHGGTEWRTIVGVVGDVRETHRDSDFSDVYLPAMQQADRYAAIWATPGPRVDEWYQQVRAIARETDPGVEIAGFAALADDARQELAGPRFLRAVLLALAALALGIALLGVYGVTAYSVEQRRREIAVRSALGAPARAITGVFLRHSAQVVAIGVGAGALGALWIGRLLENQVFGIVPTDARTLMAMTAVVAAACMAATWLPARLAAQVDPAEVLRGE